MPVETPTGQFPKQSEIRQEIQPLGATNDIIEPIFVAPYAGNVVSATVTPVAAITGANTNYRSWNVVNTTKGGTVIANISLTAGVNPAADVPVSLVLSGTAANLGFDQGDVLALQSVHAGTGLADPGGLVTLIVANA